MSAQTASTPLTVRIKAFAARQHTARTSGKPFHIQTLEIEQVNRPSAQFPRFASDEKHILTPGVHTATVSFYPAQITREGKTTTEVIARFSDFQAAK